MRGHTSSRHVVPAAVLGVLLAVLGAGAAHAEGPEVTIDSQATSIEYGEQWEFSATGAYTYTVVGPWQVSAKLSGAGSYAPRLYSSRDSRGETTFISVFGNSEVAALGAGSYGLTVSVTNGYETAQNTTPATLTIAPAALGVEVRLLSDPLNASGAIATARFTGRFVDEYVSSIYPASGLSPAGEWRIVVKASDGEVVADHRAPRVAGDDVLATSMYLAEVIPGEQYEATATFTPSGASAANFAIAQSTAFGFTAPDGLRPTPTSTATPSPGEAPQQEGGIGLPVWSLLLGGLVALASIATAVIILVGSRRAATMTVPTPSEGTE